jgi:dipeptidyl aminopeptidase/acylaminoacyl peptidase
VTASDRRAPQPDDLYRISIPLDARLSPDGEHAAFTVQRVGPSFDAYRTSIWVAATKPDGETGEPRRLTTAARRDWHARWSPDGRSLAFLSDRRSNVEEEPGAPADREDVTQVHVLPMDRPGEASRITDLPRGVEGFDWSPDGRWLAVRSASHAVDRKADARSRHKLDDPKPGEPPARDYRFFDRLGYLDNAAGFIAHKTGHLWVIDTATGNARRLSDLAAGIDGVAWSPDSTRIAFHTGPARDFDLASRSRILVVDVETWRMTEVAGHSRALYLAPTWLPDGKTIAALGGRMPEGYYRFGIHLFAADGSERAAGFDLSSRHDVMPGSTMNSDLTIGEGPRLIPVDGGAAILFLAPHRGAIELWRIATRDGSLTRLTDGQHYLSGFDAATLASGEIRVVATRSTAVTLPDLHALDLPPGGSSAGGAAGGAGGLGAGSSESGSGLALRPITHLNRVLQDEVELRAPEERWVEVDGRQVQGWLIPAGRGRRPGVLEIHGGPHTLYGWSPLWEFQVLAAAGISVVYSNPRGSEGYGLEFNMANRANWGDGPAKDVLAVVDAFVAEGRLDPERLGVTGGSYGGYLTNWLIGHDQRFKAALTARSVADMTMLFLTGDLSGTDWPSYEFGAYPAANPELMREQSPITYAANIHTPLLIQHSERDLRTTVAQAEALFATLRRLRRPVRLMRVPDETHELTRSGTPYRRVENLVQVRDWFAHFLVKGKRGLPPKPETKHGH